VYCVDLIWKLAHWNQYVGDLQWWMIVMALSMRVAVMSFLYWQYRLASKDLPAKAEISH
jgi:hypothetical protein